MASPWPLTDVVDTVPNPACRTGVWKGTWGAPGQAGASMREPCGCPARGKVPPVPGRLPPWLGGSKWRGLLLPARQLGKIAIRLFIVKEISS